jgi:hypothetical protein
MQPLPPYLHITNFGCNWLYRCYGLCKQLFQTCITTPCGDEMINVAVFWVVTPYSDVVGSQYFGGSHCLQNAGNLPYLVSQP